MQITPMVKQLLIINILFYIGAQLIPGQAYELLPMYYPENPDFHIWQIFTHMFMHAEYPNLSHIMFNMFALYSFGSALENFWGAKKFLFFYISCGLGSAILYNLVNYWQYHEGLNALISAGLSPDDIAQFFSEGKYNTNVLSLISVDKLQQAFYAYNSPMLGASGAIYGLLAAFVFMFPNAELFLFFVPVPIKAKYLIPIIMASDLILGVYGTSLFGPGGTGIAHFAHIGGALIGFMMMYYWKKNDFHGSSWN